MSSEGGTLLSTKSIRLFFALAILSALLAAWSLLFYQGKEVKAQPDGTPPPHEVLEVSDASGVREVVVATPAKRKAAMLLVAQELEEENTPEGGTLLIEYRGAKDPQMSTGFALVFDDKEAVLDAGATERFGEVYDEEDAKQIVAQEGGVRVVSFEQFAEDSPGVWERVKRFIG
jgi:hypothetical protein